jgi:alpha-D-xyloside xylohydrolase
MPYIYATASSTYFNEGSIMRGLVMDFPTDPGSKDVKDEFLFGHAFLVAPVSEYGARERKVYLPKGAQWYDYQTGERLQGGSTVTAQAPETRMPLFVKAGAIVPMGPVTQYVDEKPDAPLTLKVYTGADGKFSFYEDDGVTEDYQRGGYTRIPLSYNDKTGVLSIGAREGSYKGMVDKRTFRVHFVKPGVSSADTLDTADKEVSYEGKPVTVKL